MATPPEGYLVTAEEHPEELAILRDWARHLVCLAFLARRPELTGKPAEQIKSVFRSGFVTEFEGKWYWTTAGHILEEIDELLRNWGVVVEGFRLLDDFGSGTIDHTPIPFAFEASWRHFEYDKASGLDYGAVELGPLTQEAIRRNGIQAVPMAGPYEVDHKAFTHYVLFGFPEDAIRRAITPNSEGFTVSGKPTPTMIHVEKLDGDPGEGHRTPFPRFVGRLTPEWPKGEVGGMSGGPVFGITGKTFEHQVIAIQSHWSRQKRMTFACPLTVLLPRLVAAIRARG